MIEYISEDLVRDYECDIQGIVNNAEYMHYCEHARSHCTSKLGHTLKSLNTAQEDPVVARVEMDFKYPLSCGDRYRIKTVVEAKGAMRLLFFQKIFKLEKDNTESQLCLDACFVIAILKNHRPVPIKNSVFANLIS